MYYIRTYDPLYAVRTAARYERLGYVVDLTHMGDLLIIHIYSIEGSRDVA